MTVKETPVIKVQQTSNVFLCTFIHTDTHTTSPSLENSQVTFSIYSYFVFPRSDLTSVTRGESLCVPDLRLLNVLSVYVETDGG